MSVKRRLAKARAHRITPEAVEAYRAGDHGRLHRALGLRPWQPSPLPVERTALGVDASAPPPAWLTGSQLAYWHLACELQTELERAVRVTTQ